MVFCTAVFKSQLTIHSYTSGKARGFGKKKSNPFAQQANDIQGLNNFPRMGTRKHE
jgi:hypothetical protein